LKTGLIKIQNLFKNASRKFAVAHCLFFSHHQKLNYYDLIYIDGSHYADDVIIDSILAFSLLKKNGILIFDDYLWWYYSNPRKNPSAAINLFLKLKADSLKIIFVGYQIAIQKKY
jgi:predicted O-methyltransferase YrrM